MDRQENIKTISLDSQSNTSNQHGPDDEPLMQCSEAQDYSRDEDSPLLDPTRLDDEETLLERTDRARQPSDVQETEEEPKSVWYLFILTLGIGGLQIAWATELSNGSPYLLSLGLDKALLAFVLMAGPLTGALVQPYIGMLSDRSRSRWGKRRPFMIGFAAMTIISLLALAWTKEIVESILSIFGANRDSRGVRITAIVFAVTWVYVLDFAINAVQAAIRAFIVDNAPTQQQEDANAWASRITGFGNILGYLSGYVNLPSIFPFFGNTQFKVLCVFSAIALGTTIAISCLYIQERDPRLEDPPSNSKLSVISFFKQTFNAYLRLPNQIRKICEVQFFNWIGWFPFLFYLTTYIGQLRVNPIFEEHPNLPSNEVERYWEEATRIGSFALFLYAITSFIASVILPVLIEPSYQPISRRVSIESSGFGQKLSRILEKLRIPHFTLRRAWLYSHVLFALCMLATFVIETPTAGMIMTAFVGVSWALTTWAPFALIAAEISKRETKRRTKDISRHCIQSTQAQGPNLEDRREPDLVHDQAGVIMGLHNVSISAPQILATLVSSVIFKISQKERNTAGDNSVAWLLRFGGLAAIIAAGMTWRVREEREQIAE